MHPTPMCFEVYCLLQLLLLLLLLLLLWDTFLRWYLSASSTSCCHMHPTPMRFEVYCLLLLLLLLLLWDTYRRWYLSASNTNCCHMHPTPLQCALPAQQASCHACDSDTTQAVVPHSMWGGPDAVHTCRRYTCPHKLATCHPPGRMWALLP
jgi:hypothetical protein